MRTKADSLNGAYLSFRKFYKGPKVSSKKSSLSTYKIIPYDISINLSNSINNQSGK